MPVSEFSRSPSPQAGHSPFTNIFSGIRLDGNDSDHDEDMADPGNTPAENDDGSGGNADNSGHPDENIDPVLLTGSRDIREFARIQARHLNLSKEHIRVADTFAQVRVSHFSNRHSSSSIFTRTHSPRSCVCSLYKALSFAKTRRK